MRVLINSHWHQDHWSGNDEYARAFPGLRIISTAETRAYMSRMGPQEYAPGAASSADFHLVVAYLAKRAMPGSA